MYLVTEKKLLQKNYKGYHNDPNTIYVYNLLQTKQVSMEKVTLENGYTGWKVSFPLKFSIMNYATYFNSENEAKDYLEGLVNDYI
tara:strand:+ start:997 stop:1251 length:255 start_codon:yes stop_codon:yes gene_type:complete